jgi:hypothetical protein
MQDIIKWKRPFDDSWLYHIPEKQFKNKKEVKKYIKINSHTPGVEFEIIKLKDTK